MISDGAERTAVRRMAPAVSRFERRMVWVKLRELSEILLLTPIHKSCCCCPDRMLATKRFLARFGGRRRRGIPTAGEGSD